VFASVSDDVGAVEVAAAYKNVTAIAVGMCEGLSERLTESVYVHRFANARAAMFAHGLQDMTRLAAAEGGRIETILGLAGAGDLYVTCLGGRNGNFGRLLGGGQTPQQAQTTIGSTVEGVPNTYAALALAARDGVQLRAAPAVAAVLSGTSSPADALALALGN
jgi:glycerol-3-phosphate dehydrogenase (NAD(P)+)